MSTSLLDVLSLVLNGQIATKAHADVVNAVTSEGIRMRETITGASTVELTLNDPRRVLLRSDLFASRVMVILDGAGFELASLRKSGTTLNLTFEDAAVAELRRHKGTKVVAAGTMSRAEFCASLCREVPWIKVAYAPGPKSLVQLARGSANTTSTAGTLPGGYGLPTSKAKNVADGDSILTDGERHGANASALGASKVTSSTSPTTAAAAAVVAANPTRTKTETKKDQEDSWTAMGRIMGEIGWRVMARRKGIIIAPDTWLMSHATSSYTLGEDSKGVDLIDVEWDAGKPAATATLTVWAGAYDLVAGTPVTLTGMGVANGKWLVETIERTAHTKKATVTCIRPAPTFAEPHDSSANGTGVGGESGYGLPSGSSAASQPAITFSSENSSNIQTKGEAFVQAALTRRGCRYQGGGVGPTIFDCAGLTFWAARQVGVSFPNPVATQTLRIVNTGNLISVADGIRTRGAVLFRGTPGVNGGMSGSDHIAISLGNGQTIEARGTAYGVGVFSATEGRNWSGAGIVPGIGKA